jgi:hypothetical protein
MARSECGVQTFGQAAKRNRGTAQQRVFFPKRRNFLQKSDDRFAVRLVAFLTTPPTTSDRAPIRRDSSVPFRS